MNINSAFPSKYLKADADVDEEGSIFTIKNVKVENVGQGQKAEQKPVVYFDEVDKGLVLNKTNANFIVSITGADDTDEWKGHKIRLIATDVEYAGDLVRGIRVRRASAKKSAPAPRATETVTAPDADDIPF